MQSSQDAIWTRGLSLKQAALVARFTYLLNPVTFDAVVSGQRDWRCGHGLGAMRIAATD